MHPLLAGAAVLAALAWLFDDKDKTMAAAQTQFNKFHDRIKLDDDDHKTTLREKRDVIIADLRARLPADAPAFEPFHQGSYSMHTGTVPLDGNFDIDVGIIFDCKRDRYSDPVELKKTVRDALNYGNRTVAIRRPCVTVNYMRGETIEYHVDLAVYVKRDDGLLDLAKGKEHSLPENRIWEVSDPKKLTELICGRFKDEELAQYRRCIRDLKRWRDVQFYSGAPLSVALTVAAYRWFQPNSTLNGTYVDLLALQAWTKSMLTQFQQVTNDQGTTERLKVMLPVTPNVDLMGWMTNAQMDYFKAALEGLLGALDDAYDETLREETCKILAKQFGDEFPIPAKEETAKSVSAPYVSTGTSA